MSEEWIEFQLDAAERAEQEKAFREAVADRAALAQERLDQHKRLRQKADKQTDLWRRAIIAFMADQHLKGAKALMRGVDDESMARARVALNRYQRAGELIRNASTRYHNDGEQSIEKLIATTEVAIGKPVREEDLRLRLAWWIVQHVEATNIKLHFAIARWDPPDEADITPEDLKEVTAWYAEHILGLVEVVTFMPIENVVKAVLAHVGLLQEEAANQLYLRGHGRNPVAH